MKPSRTSDLHSCRSPLGGPRTVAACGAFASVVLIACGGSTAGVDEPTDGDTAPIVTIQAVEYQGAQGNDVSATVLVTDDHGLDSARVSLDGVRQASRILQGTQATFTVELPGLQSGSHQLVVRVFDDGGHTTEATRELTIPELRTLYDASVYMVRDDTIVPAAGKEFCVGGVCEVLGEDGRAVLEGLERPYELGIIEGANPNFVVALGPSRLDPNIINFTNDDAQHGRKPTDTHVVQGTNTRRIIYWDEAIPLQELIDLFYVSESNLRFATVPEELILNIGTDVVLPEQEILDTIVAAAYRGLDYANHVYETIPYDDPHTYDMTYDGVTNMSRTDDGAILVTYRPPDVGHFSTLKAVVRDDGLYSFFIHVTWPHDKGPSVVAQYVEETMGQLLTGVPQLVAPGSGVFMQGFDFTDPDWRERTWTDRDKQISLLSVMLDTRSDLITTEGDSPASGR